MTWKNRENNSQNPNDQTPVIDRCINCGDHEQVHAQITMEFGEVILTPVPYARSAMPLIVAQE